MAQRTAGLKVFGEVPFSVLFSEVTEQIVVRSGPGTYSTGTQDFRYEIAIDTYGKPEFTVNSNSCRSIHFSFMPGSGHDGGNEEPNETGTITVTQESLSPASASAAYNTVGTLDATLVPGESWTFGTQITGGNTSMTFMLEGTAVCDRVGPLDIGEANR